MLDIGSGGSSGGVDVSDTTATEADVLDGKIFHLADGASAVGTLRNSWTILKGGQSGAGWSSWASYAGTATQSEDGTITLSGSNKYGGNTAYFKQVDLTDIDYIWCKVISVGDTKNNRLAYVSTTQYCASAWTDFSKSTKYSKVSQEGLAVIDVRDLSGTYYVGFAQSNNSGDVGTDVVKIYYGQLTVNIGE